VLGRGLTGTVTGSKFHHNYFGLYVWGVGDMVVTGNEFYDNYFYGFDAHTVTQRTLLEDNLSHDNGGHGIIFADRCTDNQIRRNRSINNVGHGIMLHEQSDNNLIEDNTVTGNDDGIPIFESSNNVVSRNTVRDNNVGIRVYGRRTASNENTFEDNDVSGSASYGIYMYDAAIGNDIRNNRITSNGDAGVYGKSITENVFADNTVQDNEFGIRFDSPDVRTLSRANQVRNNSISGSRQYGVHSYGSAEANTFEGNRFSDNLAGDTLFLNRDPSPFAGIRMPQVLQLAMVAAIVLVAVVGAIIVFLRTRERRAEK
jgi:parallel beta-helix repeat protein